MKYYNEIAVFVAAVVLLLLGGCGKSPFFLMIALILIIVYLLDQAKQNMALSRKYKEEKINAKYILGYNAVFSKFTVMIILFLIILRDVIKIMIARPKYIMYQIVETFKNPFMNDETTTIAAVSLALFVSVFLMVSSLVRRRKMLANERGVFDGKEWVEWTKFKKVSSVLGTIRLHYKDKREHNKRIELVDFRMKNESKTIDLFENLISGEADNNEVLEELTRLDNKFSKNSLYPQIVVVLVIGLISMFLFQRGQDISEINDGLSILIEKKIKENVSEDFLIRERISYSTYRDMIFFRSEYELDGIEHSLHGVYSDGEFGNIYVGMKGNETKITAYEIKKILSNE